MLTLKVGLRCISMYCKYSIHDICGICISIFIWSGAVQRTFGMTTGHWPGATSLSLYFLHLIWCFAEDVWYDQAQHRPVYKVGNLLNSIMIWAVIKTLHSIPHLKNYYVVEEQNVGTICKVSALKLILDLLTKSWPLLFALASVVVLSTLRLVKFFSVIKRVIISQPTPGPTVNEPRNPYFLKYFLASRTFAPFAKRCIRSHYRIST